MPTNDNFEELEQYDFATDEYFEKVSKRYFPLIGEFLVSFSILEHELNLAIAEFISDRAHNTGYIVIEKLTMGNKIDMFYKLYASLELNKNKSDIKSLTKIHAKMIDINLFRNNLVHANWQTLSRDGKVRVKIVADPGDGTVKFRRIVIKTIDIRQKIRQTDRLLDQIEKYQERAFQF